MSAPIEEYRILYDTYERVQELVNEMLKGAWVPCGGATVYEDEGGAVWAAQTMVKVRREGKA